MEEVISWTETIQPPTQTLWKLDWNVWPGLQEREAANVVEKHKVQGTQGRPRTSVCKYKRKKK